MRRDTGRRAWIALLLLAAVGVLAIGAQPVAGAGGPAPIEEPVVEPNGTDVSVLDAPDAVPDTGAPFEVDLLVANGADEEWSTEVALEVAGEVAATRGPADLEPGQNWTLTLTGELPAAAGEEVEVRAVAGDASDATTISVVPVDQAEPACTGVTFEGDGTSGDPYLVRTAEELQCLGEHPSAQFALVDDVDATETEHWDDGAGFVPVSTFDGELDGRGHEIEGLTVDRNVTRAALFGTLEGTVENLTLGDVEIRGLRDAGGLYADADGATVRNVTVSGSVGIAERPWTDLLRMSDRTLGGLGGSHAGGVVEDVRANVTVRGDPFTAGGVVGHLTDGGALAVDDRVVAAPVAGGNAGGGLVGRLDDEARLTAGSLTVDANVTGNGYSGGAVGWAENATVSVDGAVVRATLDGANVGGVAGRVVESDLAVESVRVPGTIDASALGAGVTAHVRNATVDVGSVRVERAIRGAPTFESAVMAASWGGTNLTVDNVTAAFSGDGGTYTGGVVGGLHTDDSPGVSNDVQVGTASVAVNQTSSGTFTGGVVGAQWDSSVAVDDLEADLAIDSTTHYGGVVGATWDSTIEAGSTSVELQADSVQGGGALTGSHWNTALDVGAVDADVDVDAQFAGGLVGALWGDDVAVDRATIDATLAASNGAGGLYGVAYDADTSVGTLELTVEDLEGARAGGLAGHYGNGTLGVETLDLDATVRGTVHQYSDGTTVEAAGGLFGVFDGAAEFGEVSASAGNGSTPDASDRPESVDHLAVDVDGPSHAGGFAGICQASVSEVAVTGSVTSENDPAGGVCGLVTGGTVDRTEASAFVAGETAGGLVGQLDGGSIATSASDGAVEGSASVGGVVGRLESGSVTDVRSVADVNGSAAVGGVAGSALGANATVQRALAFGAVTGESDVDGGVGVVENATVDGVRWDAHATGQPDSDVGVAFDSDALSGASAAETLEAFSFLDPWTVTESYPDLHWRTTAAAAVDGSIVYDLDGDDLYRDVTGDGTVGQGDVAEFFGKQHRGAWKRPDLFDFSGNGAVTHGDVVELADYVALN